MSPAHSRGGPFFVDHGLFPFDDRDYAIVCTVTNNIVNTDLSLRTPHAFSPRTPATRPTYSIAAAVVIMARSNTVSDDALHLQKIPSPSSTPNLEPTILTDLCLRHRNYACANRVSTYLPATAKLMANKTPSRVSVSASLTENITSKHPGNNAGTTRTPNHIGAPTQPR